MPIYDFYFSGALTNYRKNILDDLSKNYKVLVEKNFIKDQDRISNMAKCKYSLNIPQSSSWKGDSLMRILFSLRNDKLVLSFNKNSINMGQLSKYIIDYDEFLRDKDSKRMKISIPNALHTNYFHEDELRLASSIKNSIF